MDFTTAISQFHLLRPLWLLGLIPVFTYYLDAMAKTPAVWQMAEVDS